MANTTGAGSRGPGGPGGDRPGLGRIVNLAVLAKDAWSVVSAYI